MGETMRAMVLPRPGMALELREVPIPRPGPDEVLVRVEACGVCRTDLHLIDGELPDPRLPLVPGHEVAGVVASAGDKVTSRRPGDRVGVPWLAGSCGACRFCRRSEENLCDASRFTGYTVDGGYAEYVVADHRYCFPLPESFTALQAAPLLCAGLIGYRAYRLAGEDAELLGIYGFGAAAHLVTQIALYQGRSVFAFTRPGDAAAQALAREVGAVWAGDATATPPEPLDGAIIFAPAGELLPAALRAVRKGGVVVCGGIHMSDIPSFPYNLLWGERSVRSVANLTRRDGEELLALAPMVPIRPRVEAFPLTAANEALDRLRSGRISGAAVLEVR
jgi:alcohol dehydrogenase, propanol-preferring